MFIDDFPRESGRARFVPADIIPANERPDAEYPFVLITGRQLEHWHTGSMTRRAGVLDAIEPFPIALIHPLDLEKLGAKPGDTITVASRRGKISLYARADDGTPHWRIIHSVLLLRSGRERVDQSRARSGRENSRIQILRRESHQRRRTVADIELRRR